MPHALPSLLDTAAAAPLRTTLLELLATGDPVRLDGAPVTRVGQACLQVLASAAAAACGAGIGFAIDRPSPELTEGCVLAGLPALVA